MYVRLAFAIAAHLEPEILIVDEVLAVGDLAFQQKCLGKMSEVSRGGRTILFVSHNMAVVEKIVRARASCCTRVESHTKAKPRRRFITIFNSMFVANTCGWPRL